MILLAWLGFVLIVGTGAGLVIGLSAKTVMAGLLANDPQHPHRDIMGLGYFAEGEYDALTGAPAVSSTNTMRQHINGIFGTTWLDAAYDNGRAWVEGPQ